MNTEQHIPLTKIRVKFISSTQRPITELDRLVMQAIAAGSNSVDSLKPIFQLPERLLVECLVDLMEMALLALDTSGSGFRLTEYGERSLKEDLTCFGEQMDEIDEMNFLREDMTGRMAPARIVRYEKKGDVQLQSIQRSIPHGEIEQLLIRELKKNNKHLHSIESITPVRDDISFKVTIEKGSISGLPLEWSHLKSLIQAETGISHATSQQDYKNEQDYTSWVEISVEESDLLLKASDHEAELIKAIEQAHSHLLILSAHASATVLNSLNDPIRAAIQRGVKVDVLFGLPALDEGGESHTKTTNNWLRGLRKSLSGGVGDYLTVNEEPLNSDAKLLIWDTPDGYYHAIVSSYNWLYGLDGSLSECLGTEIGIRLSNPQLIGNICTTLSGWIDACGQQLNGVALRWRNIGRNLATKKEFSSTSADATTATKARVIYDETHAKILQEGLINAKQRLLVSSHKLNRSATGNTKSSGGKLEWLTRRKPASEFSFILVAGKCPKVESWGQEDQNRLEELVRCVDGTMRIGTGTHARVLVYDDVAVISGYNFLSTTHGKRQIGVMFKGNSVSDALWKAFT